DVVARVTAQAEARGVPPDLAETLWRRLIEWTVDYEEERLG
ncbi:MAG: chorismate mutase, partial [Azorhizobium sp. 35-67-5]